MLEHVWLHQQRFIQLGQAMQASPHLVGASLPQGDPMSPLGLTLMLADAVRDVSRLGVKQSVFLDDRVLVSKEVNQLIRAKALWIRWTQRLGLHENLGKIKVLVQDMYQRLAFLRRGFEARQLDSQLRILGVDFVKGSSDPAAGMERLEKGIAYARRLARAPVSVDIRRSLFRTRIVPLASWGWWFHPIPRHSSQQLFRVYRLVGAVHTAASRHLRAALDGHNMCVDFVSTRQAIQSVQTSLRAGMPWPALLHQNLLIERACTSLASWGWNLARSKVIQHARVGTVNLQTDAWDKIAHGLRESWREAQWNLFLQQDRRDSAQVAGANVVYDPARLKAAQGCFSKGSAHHRAVMTGAAHSLARYQVMFQGQVQPGCHLCGNPVTVPDWERLAWRCNAFQSQRPGRPQDEAQARLGWPTRNGNAQDQHVLRHLSEVRRRILTFAPHAGGARRSVPLNAAF